ncbi:unnamed protein product, partial [Nesidiocoris tenuis]
VDTSVDDVVGDLGPSFTASTETCKGHIVQLAGRDLKASDMAHVIILMLKSRSVDFWLETEGAKDKNADPAHVPTPWNIENLVQAAKELVSLFLSRHLTILVPLLGGGRALPGQPWLSGEKPTSRTGVYLTLLVINQAITPWTDSGPHNLVRQ